MFELAVNLRAFSTVKSPLSGVNEIYSGFDLPQPLSGHCLVVLPAAEKYKPNKNETMVLPSLTVQTYKGKPKDLLLIQKFVRRMKGS